MAPVEVVLGVEDLTECSDMGNLWDHVLVKEKLILEGFNKPLNS